MNRRPEGHARHDGRQVSLAAGRRAGRPRLSPVGQGHQAGVAERELRELGELPERRETADRLPRLAGSSLLARESRRRDNRPGLNRRKQGVLHQGNEDGTSFPLGSGASHAALTRPLRMWGTGGRAGPGRMCARGRAAFDADKTSRRQLESTPDRLAAPTLPPDPSPEQLGASSTTTTARPAMGTVARV